MEAFINLGLLDSSNNTIPILIILCIIGLVVIAGIIKKFIVTIISLLIGACLCTCMIAKFAIFNSFPVSVDNKGITVEGTYIPYGDVHHLEKNNSGTGVTLYSKDGTKYTIDMQGFLAEAVCDVIDQKTITKWR